MKEKSSWPPVTPPLQEKTTFKGATLLELTDQ